MLGRKLTAIPQARGCLRTLRRPGDSQEARDLNAADIPVADAQNPLRVRGDDEVDILSTHAVVAERHLHVVGWSIDRCTPRGRRNS
jgi:hypothetical protein